MTDTCVAHKTAKGKNSPGTIHSLDRLSKLGTRLNSTHLQSIHLGIEDV